MLNMNDYIKGYEGIQNKLYEKEVQRMRQYCQAQIEKNRNEEEKRNAKRGEGKSTEAEKQLDNPPTTISAETADVEMKELPKDE